MDVGVHQTDNIYKVQIYGHLPKQSEEDLQRNFELKIFDLWTMYV